MKKLSLLCIAITLFISCTEESVSKKSFNTDEMMVRIAEIEVDSLYLEEYMSILKEEAKASVAIEPGVISIFPMFEKDTPTKIKILEIYADKKAYELHLETPHFKHYKTSTLKMVKNLKLIEMSSMDFETMPMIFNKMN
ncbi:putative quinol monooxygenase [Joostella sp. CR20]|uniref:putative quinol monooxygenase n=1 Tax=Joostella sp. CR20 TaxID=2804312 RepID=UPI00313C0031